MLNNTSNEHGGVNIVPSARKSIHHNCSCSHNFLNMGKYGISKKQERKPGPSVSQDGVDEIDNVMSKMRKHASPLPTRKTTDMLHRRNSLNNCNTEDSEEDDEDMLSKSSPPTFSYSSEELYTSAVQSMLERSRNELSRNNSFSNDNNSPRRSQNLTANNYNSSILQQQECNETNISHKMYFLILAIIVIVLGVVGYGKISNDPVKIYDVYDKFRFENDVNGLKKKYKVADNSMLIVRSGITTIFEKEDTASFIFAYDSEENGFNPMKFNNFIEDIASTASRYLRNESNEVYTTVDTTKLMMRTEKEFMNYYRDAVTKTGVMLVKDIDNVPSQLVMAFHYYCDEYNPLVKQSAIFFTMNLAKCSQSSDKKSTHDYIEKCLAKKWNTVDQDKIAPLLTRVVNIVVDVTQPL